MNGLANNIRESCYLKTVLLPKTEFHDPAWMGLVERDQSPFSVLQLHPGPRGLVFLQFHKTILSKPFHPLVIMKVGWHAQKLPISFSLLDHDHFYIILFPSC